MLGQTNAKKLIEGLLDRCQTDQAEALLFSEDKALTRFANNSIHQNVAEANITLILRYIQGKQIGTATTNHLDEPALDELVTRARANAAASPEDPKFPGLAGPAEYEPAPSFDEETLEYSPRQRAEAVAEICRLAQAKKLSAFGAFSTGGGEVVVANTRSVFAYHASTQAEFSSVIMGDNGSGFAGSAGWKAGDLPIQALGQEAIRKAEMAQNPQPVEPGAYTVILDPYATQDLLGMLNMGMGAQAVLDGRSWMNDRLGQQVMSPLVNIYDDGFDPLGLPMPFDFEGVPKQCVELVKNGVVMGPVYDRATALKAGEQTTGHALPPTARGFGPLATNLFMSPGQTSTDELIRSTENGLYITRFWYTRVVHPRDCVITGMTRDGVYWIENGQITTPVKNLRFTQSYVQALADLEAVGSESRTGFAEFGNLATRAPALKIKRFNFTGVTV